MVSSVYENKSFSQRCQGRKDFVGAAPCGCPSLALSFRANPRPVISSGARNLFCFSQRRQGRKDKKKIKKSVSEAYIKLFFADFAPFARNFF